MTLPVSAGAAAAGVRRVVIVGAGGFGREVRFWARDAWGETGVEFAGHLGAATGGSDAALRLLGDPELHAPRDDEGFLLAIGIPGVRRRVAEGLASRGARFLTLIHPTAVVSPAAHIAEGVSIGAYSVIEAGVTLAQGCSIGTHCLIGGNAHIAQGTVIQNNVSVGGVGLGFHFAEDGERLFFPHLGAVLIGANAVIGSGCVIARGQLSDTVIGAGSRLGNLVNVGHNVRIGDHCAISSGTSIAGGVQQVTPPLWDG